MGDRSNIYFRAAKGGVGVYGHWSGLSVADAAAKVMKSKAFRARVGDASYATRIGVQIVLEELGASSKSETGFGLWTSHTGPDDNEHAFIVIDVTDGSLFVTSFWNKTVPSQRIANPTATAIRKRMKEV